jgi:hypothetical protein
MPKSVLQGIIAAGTAAFFVAYMAAFVFIEVAAVI